jgi:hypothetical protein
MKKLPLFLLLSSIISIQTICHAQLGKQVNLSIAIPSMSKSTVPFDGKMGWGFGYGLFAKYSERAEWTTGFNYTRSSFTNTAYSINNVGIATKSINTTYYNLYDVRYQITYYAIPDKLGIMAGFIVGMNISSSSEKGNSFLTTSQNSLDGISVSGNEIVALRQSNQILETSDYNGTIFQYGFRFGLSYTLAERYIFSAEYNLFLNDYFEKEGDLNDFLGGPNPRLLAFGFGYKFLPNIAKKRF